VIADEWPDADLRILPKAGHWPQFEAPNRTRRLVAAYLGLPRFSDRLQSPVGDDELLQIREIAQFLAHSDVGNNLNLAHRTRLAAQLKPRFYDHGENIVRAAEAGNELYISQSGTGEVWNDSERTPGSGSVAVLRPGQIAGELAMLDQGLRSANLIAGSEGATVLTLKRDDLLALCEDDAVLGTRLLWNIATAVAQRGRFFLWQLQHATRRSVIEARWQGQKIGSNDRAGNETRQLAANVDPEGE